MKLHTKNIDNIMSIIKGELYSFSAYFDLLKLFFVTSMLSFIYLYTITNAHAETRSFGSNANQHSTNYSYSGSKYRYSGNNSYSKSYGSNSSTKSNDKIRTLITNKTKQYNKASRIFYTDQNSNSHTGHNHSDNEWSLPRGFSSANLHSSSYYDWIDNAYNKKNVRQYERYLAQHLGKNNIPPMSQLLLTARSWRKCGASAYEVPPNYLWGNMTPTLQLYTHLKNQNVIPTHTVIRSVYRNPHLNKCAGGANGSKHKMNAAMDLWLPEFQYDKWYKGKIQEQLCQFWLYNGERYNMGLGIYRTGSIHIDTQGYRKWGTQHTPSYSSCRY